ncbi:hypothetical protein MMC09_005859 [Bachmanniomyces sp. S44760]|nr:hypothetical protein [Bachmanniomyces sp. S44760]
MSTITTTTTTTDQTPSIFTLTTVLSLLATVALLSIAYLSSLRLLSPTCALKLRILYVWHLFDSLTHLILEGSFLYNCFFTYALLPDPSSDYPHPASLGVRASPPFLGYADRTYGSAYGSNPFAKLWMEYAKADRRWGEADLTIISLELLTVLVAGPLALYITELIRRSSYDSSTPPSSSKGKTAKTTTTTPIIGSASLWFWATVLATGELYGGFMTFAPEWMSANTNLDCSNFMYLWIYLFFFNTLWVWIPLWVLWEAFGNMSKAFEAVKGEDVAKKTM